LRETKTSKGASADQVLRSYIRLAALHLRWQNLWSYWAIAVVPTLLGRIISPLFTDQCEPVADRLVGVGYLFLLLRVI